MFNIYTLGNFEIRYNDKSILETKGYPYKTLKLFKYFLTHEGKRLLPENIIEDIWEDNEYTDPGGALRTQISRVRNLIDLESLGLEAFFEIKHMNGYYIFTLEENCSLDIREFESRMKLYDTCLDKNQNEKLLREIIALYNGSYLPELEDEDWIIPIRSRFDRIYIKALMQVLKILMEKKMYHDIISICEEAMQYKFYEESIHIYFLEALIAIGQEKYASNHYKFYTSKFYNDLGIAPSKKSREAYKRLQSKKENKGEEILNLNIIKRVLREDDTEGALICAFDYFKFLYNFEIRNRERNKDVNIYLSIITIDNLGYKPLKEDEIREEMSSLKTMVYENMRKGDVLSQWNDSQLVLLLYNVKEENIEGVIKRLKNDFEEKRKQGKIILNIKYKKI